MKNYLPVVFLLMCLNLCAQTSRALVVAIDKYPEANGWSEIHGTNDGKIVVGMLKANNYPENNIRYLENQQATKLAIVAALKKLASRASKGDYIYIHFSCHGQQMLDNNGDEPDGLDEALIPYDARRRFAKGIYEGENHLRDDEFEILLDDIRNKLRASGNLTVVLDACHSGTANRDGNDEEYVRGTAYVFAPDGYTLPEINSAKVVTRPNSANNLSALTIFSACLPDQLNYEYRDSTGKYYGSLTYAFCSLMRNQNNMATNKDLHAQLIAKINTLFAGKKRQQTPYFESTNENKTFQIDR